jgi:hypothetical protein
LAPVEPAGVSPYHRLDIGARRVAAVVASPVTFGPGDGQAAVRRLCGGAVCRVPDNLPFSGALALSFAHRRKGTN